MIPLSEAEVLYVHFSPSLLGDNDLTFRRCGQVIREGNDITLVGWGAQLTIMEQACLDAEKVLALYFKSIII